MPRFHLPPLPPFHLPTALAGVTVGVSCLGWCACHETSTSVVWKASFVYKSVHVSCLRCCLCHCVVSHSGGNELPFCSAHPQGDAVCWTCVGTWRPCAGGALAQAAATLGVLHIGCPFGRGSCFFCVTCTSICYSRAGRDSIKGSRDIHTRPPMASRCMYLIVPTHRHAWSI